MAAKRKTYATMTEALREAIAESELSFKALERETGVLRQSLMKFARDETSLRLDVADKLAEFFALRVEQSESRRTDNMDTKVQFGVDLVFLPNHAYAGDDDDNTERHDQFIGLCETGMADSWTSKKTAELGDIYLFWFGGPIFRIAGIGVSQGCDGEPVGNQGWDWTDADYGFFCDYDPLVALANPITIDDIKGDRLGTGSCPTGGPGDRFKVVLRASRNPTWQNNL